MLLGRRVPLWLIPLAAVSLLLVAAACSSSSNETTTSPTGSSAAGSATPSGEVGPGVSATEIKLGMTNDLAGVGKTPYGPITTALKAYFNYINTEKGGVCGRNITLLAEDDQYNPAITPEKTKKLVEQDQVLAIVDALGTATHAAVVDYLNQKKVPDLFVASGWSGWSNSQKWPWTIGYNPDYVSDAKALMKYASDNFKGQKVGILYQNDDFGKDYLNGLKASIGDESLLVGQQSYEATATDITSQMANIRDSGAQVVMLAATPAFAAKAIIAAHLQNYKPTFLVSNVSAPTTMASIIGGGTGQAQLAKGFQEQAGDIGNNYVLDPIADKGKPEMVAHAQIMAKYGGGSVNALTVYAQSQGELIVETLKRACNNLNRPGVLAAAESIKGFHTSMLLPGIDINLGHQDHDSIRAFQPVETQADGTLLPKGNVIDLEKAASPTP